MITLGQKIRQLREAKDLSLRDLGKKLGKTAAFLSDIELGRRNPSDEVLVEIARVLGSSIEDLKQFDRRPPLEEIKRKAAENPTYGFAFRRVVEENVSPEELLQLAEKKRTRGKKNQ
jgi:transcriptional regulator with XRE-family HTH domain